MPGHHLPCATHFTLWMTINYSSTQPACFDHHRIYNWPLQLYPYIKSTQIFYCPTQNENQARSGWTDNGTSNPYVNTFGKPIINTYAALENVVNSQTGSVAIAAVPRVSSVYLMGDVIGGNMTFFNGSFPRGFNRMRYSKPCPGTTQIGGGVDVTGPLTDECGRHFGGTVIVFMDGHAKWLHHSRIDTRAATYTRDDI